MKYKFILLFFILTIVACKKENSNEIYQLNTVNILTKDGNSNTIIDTRTIIISHNYWDSIISTVNSGYTNNANELNYHFNYDSTVFDANINQLTFQSYSFQTGIYSSKLNFNYLQNKLDSINYISLHFRSKGKTDYMNGNVNSITFLQNYFPSNDTSSDTLKLEYPSKFQNQKNLIGIDLNDLILNTYINSNLFRTTLLIPNYRSQEVGLLLNSYFSYMLGNNNLIEKIQSTLQSKEIIVTYFFDSNNNNRVTKMILTEKTSVITDLITEYTFNYK